MSISGIGSVASTSQLFETSTVSATDSNASDTQSATRPKRSQFQGDFASLLAAVQSGDMSSAQKALTTVQSDIASAKATYSTQPTASKGQVPTDVQSLFDAVQQGDADAAKKALAKLQADIEQNGKAAGAKGHHHHHHVAAPNDASTATSATPIDPASSTGTAGSTLTE